MKLPKKGVSLAASLFAFGGFYVVFALLFYILSAASPFPDGINSAFSEVLAVACGVLLLKKLTPKTYENEYAEYESGSADEKREERHLLRDILSGLICGTVLLFANILYARYVYGSTDAPDLPLYVMIPLIGILVPLAEEIFFRGALLGYMKDRGFCRSDYIAFTSIVFAAIHDEKVMPLALFAGILLGLCCDTSAGKLRFIPSFIAHAVYNTSLCILAFIGGAN